MRTIFSILIFIGMILSAIYGTGDLFFLIMGGIFVLVGIATFIRYLRTGEMIESFKTYEYLRGRKSALFMGGFVFVLISVFYFIFLIDYITQ